MHVNACSINHNLPYLTDLLSTIELDFTVIGISETWLQNNKDPIPIQGYDFVHKCRSDKPGGGVGMFVNNEIDFKLRHDIGIFDSQIMESVFIELPRANETNIIIGTIYRPPNTNIQVFIAELNRVLAKLSNEQKPCYLMGDFNIDLLKYQHHNDTSEFLVLQFLPTSH